jgi:hypothetical protein
MQIKLVHVGCAGAVMISIAAAIHFLRPLDERPAVGSREKVSGAASYKAKLPLSAASEAARTERLGVDSRSIGVQSINQKIEEMLASGDSKRRFTAAFVVQQCMMFEASRRQAGAPVNAPLTSAGDGGISSEDCKDMNWSYRSKRLDWVKAAVKDRVPNAAYYLVAFGPEWFLEAEHQRADERFVQWQKETADFLRAEALAGNAGASGVMALLGHGKDGFAGEDAGKMAFFILLAKAQGSNSKLPDLTNAREFPGDRLPSAQQLEWAALEVRKVMSTSK